MLLNESYTGRLIYRRTKSVVSRGPGGKKRRRAVDRPEEEWVEIPGASPRIIDDVVWERVQKILNDPERRKRRRTPRPYPLRGRLKCGVCGSAMVGQTMTSKGQEYRYYGCRHIYDRTTGHDCSARYVRGDALEAGIWQEIRRVLSSPEIVLQELQRPGEDAPDPTVITTLERALTSLDQREKRLIRLYSFGEVDEGFIREETVKLRNERGCSRADCGTPQIGTPKAVGPR